MASDGRFLHNLAVPDPPHLLRNAASAASLRSRENSLPANGDGEMGAQGPAPGNVRVVVRVRGFLPRGMPSPPVCGDGGELR